MYHQYPEYPLRIFLALLGSIVLISLSACNDTSTTPVTPTDTTLTSKSITITPDSVRDFYYSFDLDSAVVASDSMTSKWDMCVRHVFGGGRTVQIDVLFNSGSVNDNGKTMAYVVDTTFDNVTTYTAANFRSDSVAASGRIASVALDGTGMFNYNPSTHLISPNSQKTVIIKSANSNVYKLQFVSLSVPMSTYDLSTFALRYLKASGTRLK